MKIIAMTKRRLPPNTIIYPFKCSTNRCIHLMISRKDAWLSVLVDYQTSSMQAGRQARQARQKMEKVVVSCAPSQNAAE